jgi:thiosulfate/3-mercaptopyruvate sulfurtransferase
MVITMLKHLILAVTGLLAATSAMAEAPAVEPLVEPKWLAEHLDNEDLVVLDVRSKIDGSDRQTYEAGHIPGAIYSSYTEDGWRTTRDGVVGMLPPVPDLEQLIGGLGIDNDDAVVIVPAGVGATDFGSAARVYWTFKVLGHDRVAILDGGYKAWTAAGLDVEQGSVDPQAATFEANFRPELVATAEEVEAAEENGVTLVDSRPADYFKGETKHPKARVAGTIPGSLNLEQQKLVEGESADFVDRETLQQLIAEVGLDNGERRAVTTFCNTGHWASTTWFALSEVAGYDNVAMYDGSMVEWTADESHPVAVAKRGLARLLDFFTN